MVLKQQISTRVACSTEMGNNSNLSGQERHGMYLARLSQSQLFKPAFMDKSFP